MLVPDVCEIVRRKLPPMLLVWVGFRIADLINARKQSHTEELFFFFGLGDDTPENTLHTLACDTDSIYKQVEEGDEMGLTRCDAHLLLRRSP